MPDYVAALRRDMQVRLREIDMQLKAVESLLDEKARIEQALQRDPFLNRQESQRSSRSRRRAQRRAPRGENRRKALELIEQRPGVSHAELASATGINRGVLYGVARLLVERGEIERVELPGGVGYRLAQISSEVPVAP